ncbi:hypothetical protein M9Y10_005635 [Tritrichomonas musculus]|uniref:Uncharacterized protein n=1 Tax=Tritrichomonas musculus TaxID=1915356 RepID=A0ABR2JCH0_9EUKA
MKPKQTNQWKTIIVFDDSKIEIKRYELDDVEKLKVKMKRKKKRSLMLHSKLSMQPPKEDNVPSPTPHPSPPLQPPHLKFNFFNEVIFSYSNNQRELIINDKVEFQNPTQFTLPSLVEKNKSPEKSSKFILISDIIDASDSDLKNK